MTDDEKKRYVREKSASLAWLMDLVEHERHKRRDDDSDQQAEVRREDFSRRHLDDFVFLAKREETCQTCENLLTELQTLHIEAGGLQAPDAASERNRQERLALSEKLRQHRQSTHPRP